MPQLSSGLWMLKPRYDAVIIGSGYGGAIAASRLSRSKRPDGTPIAVCVLERGNEIPTGEFPEEPGEAKKQYTLDTKDCKGIGNGLYYFHCNKEITVLQGCGLGGTSLINANVSLHPQARVFKDPQWPRAIREDADGRLEAGFKHALSMLGASPYPDKAPHGPLLKYAALESAAGPGANVYHPPINVNFEEGINAVGVHQKACSGCGNCVSGCNVGAKNTLTKNYLPDAKNHGAEIFCGIAVRSIARRGDAWAVYYVPVGQHRERYGAPEMFVLATTVIVSAGSLGSTEILLRSQKRGLACSDFLGHRFTGNGDVLGFAYNGDKRVNGVGRVGSDSAGPTITGVIDLRETDELADGFIVEDGAMPAALERLLPLAFKAADVVHGEDANHSVWHTLKQWGREAISIVTSFAGGAYRGSIAHTLTFLAMSYDDDHGSLKLEDDRVRVHWPDAAKQPVWERVTARYQKLASKLGADYVPSPLFTKCFKFDVLTVHPLGGCVHSDDAASGVVNDRGQVFAETSGSRTHPDLYVMDGSTIPQPVGVNPLLTISALAERNVRLLIDDHGWTLDESLTPGQKAVFDGTRDAPRPITLQFSERMAGYLTATTADFADAAEQARARGHTATGIFGIMSPDLDAMLGDPDRTARLTGTVQIDALSPDPMMVYDGIFNLFVNVNGKRHKQMRYRMGLGAIDGKRYYLDGFKEVEDHRGIDVYADTTTLFSTVHEGTKEGAIVAKGIIKINAQDVGALVETMVAFDRKGEPSLVDRLRFGKLFIGDLWDVYGIPEKLARR